MSLLHKKHITFETKLALWIIITHRPEFSHWSCGKQHSSLRLENGQAAGLGYTGAGLLPWAGASAGEAALAEDGVQAPGMLQPCHQTLFGMPSNSEECKATQTWGPGGSQLQKTLYPGLEETTAAGEAWQVSLGSLPV